jgi:hypothetical protein
LTKLPTSPVDNPHASEPVPARELTPRVAWRTWGDPHVRLWWVTALVVLAAGVYVGATQMIDRYTEVRVLRHGTPAVATVEALGNAYVLHGQTQPGDSPVVVRFDWQGHSISAAGHLAGRPVAQFINIGEKVEIRVDPSNPAIWTSRQQPEPILNALGVPLAVLAVAALVGTVSLLLRRRLLRGYRFGTRASARVISRFRSALAPALWTVRCVLVDSDDKQVFSVYVPSRVPCQSGETVEVILPPSGGGSRRLAAAWFE